MTCHVDEFQDGEFDRGPWLEMLTKAEVPKDVETLAYKMYYRTSVRMPYRPRLNWFWYRVWKMLRLYRYERERAMTKQEVTQEFMQRLLEAVTQCDKEILVAYEKRGRAVAEWNKWLLKAYKEASDNAT